MTEQANYLYIHIPFCIKKCRYCDFYSIPLSTTLKTDYIKSLCKELNLRKTYAGDIKTIYIGGGTPTTLSEDELSLIMRSIKNNFSINSDVEITIEANPKTISYNKALHLLREGVNRISIGVQSLNDYELKILGRSHTVEDSFSSIRDARRAGFENISVDLIYGIPDVESDIKRPKKKIQEWIDTLKKVIDLNPEHISTYELTPEKGTPIYDDIKNKRLVLPEEEIVEEMYYQGVDILRSHGYVHYEISNFSRPKFECRHNLNYWDRGCYLGIGAGAHSFIDSKRSSNLSDINSYTNLLNEGILPIDKESVINDEEALKEYIFLGLRKIEGVNISTLLKDKGSQLKKAIDDLTSYGLVELNNGVLKLKRKGIFLINEIIVQVLLHIEKNHLL